MSKLFSYDGVAIEMLPKSEFWKDGYCAYIGKNDVVWLLWGIFKVYLKQNIITVVLRKVIAHSVVICRLIKKSIMQIKIDRRREKIDSGFAHEVLVRRNLMKCIYLFTPQETEKVGNSR